MYRVAQELDLTETALRRWVNQAEADAGEGPIETLKTTEREELRKLRRENRRLRMERDFLREAAASFARDSSSHNCLARHLVLDLAPQCVVSV